MTAPPIIRATVSGLYVYERRGDALVKVRPATAAEGERYRRERPFAFAKGRKGSKKR